jgi:hypothetical protein
MGFDSWVPSESSCFEEFLVVMVWDSQDKGRKKKKKNALT